MIKIFGAACCFIGFIICIFFIIKITDGLNEGKLQLQEGRLKLKKYDNWFIRIFAGRKLEKGKEDFFDGEKKYSLFWKIRLACILICIGCAIGMVACFF